MNQNEKIKASREMGIFQARIFRPIAGKDVGRSDGDVRHCWGMHKVCWFKQQEIVYVRPIGVNEERWQVFSTNGDVLNLSTEAACDHLQSIRDEGGSLVYDTTGRGYDLWFDFDWNFNR